MFHNEHDVCFEGFAPFERSGAPAASAASTFNGKRAGFQHGDVVIWPSRRSLRVRDFFSAAWVASKDVCKTLLLQTPSAGRMSDSNSWYSTPKLRRLCLVATASLLCSPSFGQLLLPPSSFHIAIIDGEGALNNVEGRVAREPIVQVEDKNHKRVEGAYVEFDTSNVPGQPGAQFANGSTKLIATTNATGQAVAKGILNNGVTGQFGIHVIVRYQGQVIGTGVIHQANICRKVAHASRYLEHNPVGNQNAPPLPAGIAGVAVGWDMLVNGSFVEGDANLMDGERLQTLSSPVKVFVGDNCRFLLSPNSVALVSPNRLALEKGAARSEPFGNCSIDSHGLELVGESPTAQGVARVGGGKLEVGSISGNVRVLDSKGVLKNVVNPCTATLFTLLPGGGISTGTLVVGAAAAALSAGVVASGAPVDRQRPPTSP